MQPLIISSVFKVEKIAETLYLTNLAKKNWTILVHTGTS